MRKWKRKGDANKQENYSVLMLSVCGRTLNERLRIRKNKRNAEEKGKREEKKKEK